MLFRSDTTSRLEDDAWIVIRFRHSEDWADKLAKYPNVFGVPCDGLSETGKQAQ